MRAADADGYIGTKAVKVTVDQRRRARGGNPVEDPATSWYCGNGERHRPRRQHIRPNLAVEIDGVRAVAVRHSNTGPIAGATSDTYTPKAGDVGGTLTATASYTDGDEAE